MSVQSSEKRVPASFASSSLAMPAARSQAQDCGYLAPEQFETHGVDWRRNCRQYLTLHPVPGTPSHQDQHILGNATKM